ncbi:MAG: DUF1573 domain-containing protein [Bacteroidota bacterium]
MRRRSFPWIGAMFLAVGLTVGGLSGCAENPEQRAKEGGKEILFDEKVHDYGEIAQESDGTWSFVFRNIGKEAIVINQVRSTCGCTIPAWPREPIEPNGTGEITVEYDTSKAGTFMKSVFVYTTAVNSPVKLQIKGKVVPVEE